MDIDAIVWHMCVMKNPRLNIVVTKPQLTWIEREAKLAGVTVGEFLRRIIDQVRDGR